MESWLKQRGLRTTRERRIILSHAFEHFGHFEAGDLLESLRRHGQRISRATVYRTIAQLVETGLLRRHDTADRRTFYEPCFGREHHEHMLCVRCGRILEFVQHEIERLQDEVCRAHGFRPLSHTLQIRGVCEACRDADRSSIARPRASHG